MCHKKIIALIILLFGFISITFSQVIISGTAPTYSNNLLEFKAHSDPISNTERTIATAKVSAEGNFSCTLQTNEILKIILYLGIYKGELFIEPGKSYNILLPEKKEKTQSDRLNPYFDYTLFHIAVTGQTTNDLNFKILAFDDAYYPYFNKFAQNPYTRTQPEALNKAISELQELFKLESSPYFKQYVKYRIGYLQHMAYQQKSKAISKMYFEGKPVLYKHPAYGELLNHVYDRYFYFFGRTVQGKKIYDNINIEKSYSNLCKTLTTDSTLASDTLREIVIIKNIHDEFYASNFSRSGLLSMLDSLIITSKIEENKKIATNVKQKIARLMPGFKPQSFELFGTNDTLVRLSDFEGSYVYLNFCICTSYSCLKEFDALLKVTDRFKEKLVIITIADDDNLEDTREFVKQSGYKWVFLHTGNQPEILEQYDIRAYPTYFLIGPDGNLILSPAPSPAEGFEMQLFKIMRTNKHL